ncbi:hypothetical protein Ddye_026598 [Dipteronia dyeriana]|uniref:Manganese/iron superoxide dismutase C-terminal domain-containing protein n=1 Tax=Dipteronia dyeriana TaxID=168575 RepID=A0AAD9TMZ6_9ROSI|nr:hypothetical protein Ddye_026598 [Dipteronia dyeriana]
MVAAAANPVWLTFPYQDGADKTYKKGLSRYNFCLVGAEVAALSTECIGAAYEPEHAGVSLEKAPQNLIGKPEQSNCRNRARWNATGRHHTCFYNRGDILPPFNNAAQAWNHGIFWESMKPGGGGKPSGDLLELTEREFGSFETFLSEFKSAASTQFGSGWAWLCYKANRLDVENAVNPLPSDEDKKLVVVKSPNAVNPLVWDYSLITNSTMGFVLFEQNAYYLDFQNRRPDYISVFMDKLVSWEAVSNRLEIAKVRAAGREVEEERRKREEEEQESDGEAVVMYLDKRQD